MALKPLTILAALGAVYFVSSQSKAATTSKKDNKDKPVIEYVPPPPESDVNDEEEIPLPPPVDLPDLPDIFGETPLPKGDLVEEGQIVFKPNLSDFYGEFLINDDEFPHNPSSADLWISQSCKSWGIGKMFEGRLPAKYVFEEFTDPEALLSPIEYWTIHGKEISPAPHYIANLPNDPIYRSWARNLIQYYSGGKCGYDIPQKKDFSTQKQFDESLTLFEKSTPLGQLYKKLYQKIGLAMYDHWASQYPEEAMKEDLRYGALWAVRNYPNLSTTNQTDEAYKKLFSEDPNAPKKLDPKKPSHKQYIDAWVNINQWIKGYKQAIKHYGDTKDPLE
jgi:hypothetical protein